MQIFDKFKKEQERKNAVIEKLDDDILNTDMKPEERVMLLKARRDEKKNYVDAGDVLKVVANLVVLGILVGVEMTQVLSQKGSRFIKVL